MFVHFNSYVYILNEDPLLSMQITQALACLCGTRKVPKSVVMFGCDPHSDLQAAPLNRLPNKASIPHFLRNREPKS